jgi:hypothetical protein
VFSRSREWLGRWISICAGKAVSANKEQRPRDLRKEKLRRRPRMTGMRFGVRGRVRAFKSGDVSPQSKNRAHLSTFPSYKTVSAKGAISNQSATGRIRRGEPGASHQDYGNPKTSALKARFTSALNSMQEYRELFRKLSGDEGCRSFCPKPVVARRNDQHPDGRAPG